MRLHNRVPYNTSPYLPLSIFYKNLIYIDIERVPEFSTSRCAQQLACFASRAEQAPRSARLSVCCLQRCRPAEEAFSESAVSRISPRSARRTLIARVRSSSIAQPEGDLLHKFALYCALDEVLHKQDRNRWTWQHWPEQFQSPDSEACQAFAPGARQAHRILQIHSVRYRRAIERSPDATRKRRAYRSGSTMIWPSRPIVAVPISGPIANSTSRAAGWALRPMTSLPMDKTGPFLRRMHLNTGKTATGFIAKASEKWFAREGRFASTMSCACSGLFWIPEGFSAAEGIYVRDNALDLMRILALESVRSENIIIGEDLGTVTDEIRDTLAQFAILSYRLVLLREKSPRRVFQEEL